MRVINESVHQVEAVRYRRWDILLNKRTVFFYIFNRLMSSRKRGYYRFVRDIIYS